MKTTVEIILLYLLIVNLTGFAAMGIDKRRAINHAWRIPESTLFGIAIIGGSLGSILGMKTFRHKTKHPQFVWGMPIILFLQIAIILGLHLSPIHISIM